MASPFYAVAIGRNGPAIYRTWLECQKEVIGYSGAVYKKFADRDAAEDFVSLRQKSPPPSDESREAHAATKAIDIFIDGACKNNGKSRQARGAYACHFPLYPQYSRVERLKGEVHTNNRAEFSALLLAHRQAARLFIDLPDLADRPLIIYTDSELLYKSVTLWIAGWKIRGWRKKSGDPVANVDLLQEIDSLTLSYSLHHVRAHTGRKDYWSVNNAAVDRMAANL